MSLVHKESIQVAAQSIGISDLSDDVAEALAPDVEYRMREIMQEAIKCMHHSKRATLTVDDVNSALSLRNVEPLYGFASQDPLRFRRALGHSDLYYIDDRDLDFKEIVEAPLPKPPLDVTVTAHWLAVEGVQPAIPENAPVEPLPAPLEAQPKAEAVPGPSLGTSQGQEAAAVEMRPAVKHVLSEELQLYFEKVTEVLILRGGKSPLLADALHSLATDAGLHPLVPYFTQFIADEVTRGLDDFALMQTLMRTVRSLLHNPHIHIEPYLHQLMPAVMTCVVAKRLGSQLADNHWALRDYTASLVAFICKRYGHAYAALQPRVTKTLVNAFLDPRRALVQHYGAIRALTALGPRMVRLLILPNLATYLAVLSPELASDSQLNAVKRYEAWRVYGALQSAAGACVYSSLRAQPRQVAPRGLAAIRPGAKVATKKPQAVAVVRKRPPGEEIERAGKQLRCAFPEGSEVKAGEEKGTMAKSTDEPVAEPVAEPECSPGQEPPKAAEKEVVDLVEEEQPTAASPLGDANAASAEGAGAGSLPKSPAGEDVDKRDSGAHGERGMETGLGGDGPPAKAEPPGEDLTQGGANVVLATAWKEDVDSGALTASLMELFGEGMMSFVPLPEMSMFL